MRWACFVLLLAGIVAIADQPKNDAGKKDFEKMQGEWVMESMIFDGQPVPDDDAQSRFRSVKGDQYAVTRFDKPSGKGTFSIDATQKPKTIDLTPVTPKGKGPTIKGIYEFDGEKIRMCYGRPGTDRPKEFKSVEDSMISITVWEREKK